MLSGMVVSRGDASSARLGPALPRVLIGTSALGNLYQVMPDGRRAALVRAALAQATPEHPVCFDSAGKYGAGLSLETLGRHLREQRADPRSVRISVKLGWRRAPLTTPEPTFEPGAWAGLQHDAVQDISGDGIRRCADEADALLGAPWTPDHLSVHDPDEYLAAAADPADADRRWDDVRAAYRTLDGIRRQRGTAIGIGAKDDAVIARVAEVVPLDWAMLACVLTIHRHDARVLAVVESLRRGGVPVIASAVFNAGFLTGGAWYDYRRIDLADPADQGLVGWRERFLAACRRFDVPPSAACVRFVLAIPGVVSVALNATTPERIAANQALTEADIPAPFWTALKDAGVIDRAFPYLG